MKHSETLRPRGRRLRRLTLPLLEVLEDRTLLDAAGDTLAAALVTNLGTGSGTYTLNRELLGNGPATTRDVDLFRFQAPVNARLTARTVYPGAGSQVNTVLRVFNAGGTEIALNNDCGQSLYSCVDVRLATAGLYYVGVSGNPNTTYDPTRSASGPVGATGDYRLEMTLATVATSTVLSSSANPSVTGQGITLTATVSSASGTPTGAVSFRDGSTLLATVGLTNGRATFTTSTLSTSAHTLSAEYSGAGTWVPSTSAPLNQQVNRAATRVTLTSSANPAVVGQNVVFTASVTALAPGGGVPGGDIIFIHNNLEDSVELDANGRATFSISTLALGNHVIQAEYQGDERYLDAPLAEITQRVNQAQTTTRLQSSANPAFIDQQIIFTATVATQAPGAGLPAGSVTFFLFGNPLSTMELDGAGQAAHTLSSLPLGTHDLTAIYNGSPSHQGSSSPVHRQEVSRYLTTTAVTSSLNPSLFGQAVTYRATVRTTQQGGAVGNGIVTFRSGNTVLGTGTVDTQGEAAFTTTMLSSGRHTITAAFDGNARYAPSASPVLNQQVNGRASRTAIGSSVNPSVFGQSVTFTATVTAVETGFGTPGGQVTFRAGATTLGTATLNGAGVATLATTNLALGTQNVTAEYAGDARFAGSSSSAFSQRVNAAATVTALASSGSPTVVGAAVTFTATVLAAAPGSGTPAGTVTFRNGAATLGTANLVNGRAVLTVSNLPFGRHGLTAVYNGEARFTASTSTVFTQTILYPSRVLLSVPSTSVFGQTITIAASVNPLPPGVGRPMGTVTFRNGATVLGTVTVNPINGFAPLDTSALPLGAHNLTATYSGDANYVSSSSPTLPHRVNSAASRTVLSTSGSPAVFGQSITFTAVVSVVAPGSGTPTGTVAFRTGNTTLATVALANGRATFSTSGFGIGTTNVVAVYNGEARFTASTSNTVGQLVNRANTVLALVSSANPAVFGQTISFTATVTAAAPGSGTPAGSVTFRNGATVLATVNLASSRATFNSAALAVNVHNITATYNGEARFNAGSSAAVSQRVNPASTRTELVSSANPSVLGVAVTFTATVSAVGPGTGTPAGNVTFRNGNTVLGTVALANRVARLTSAALGQGTHQITATYNGETRFTTSVSPAVPQLVRFRTTTALISSANPAVFGQTITYTATISGPPGNGTPTGNVLFRDGANNLLRVALTNGRATYTTSTLTVGGHSINANYEGDSRFAPSTLALNQTINRAATRTTLTGLPNPTVFGQAFTLTATLTVVAPGAGTPTGTVTFRVPNSTVFGTVAVVGGVARLALSTLGVGTTNIVAIYNADARFNASTSAVVPHTVTRANSQTVLASSANPGVFGQSLTFTATVTAVAPGSGTPAGSVTFRNGAAVLGTINLANGVARLTTAALGLGTHAVTATYNGEARFNTSGSSTVTQRVNAANTVTAITSSVNPAVFGQAVVLTAIVTAAAPATGVPTGNVTFREGTSVLGTVNLASGRAAITLPSLSVSLHGITATFNGEARFTTSTSAIFNQRVNPAASRTTVTAAPASTVFGQAVTFTANVVAVAPGTGIPTGTVQFRFGNTVMGSAAVGANARAILTFTGLPAGLHAITAVYQGETRYTASTSAAVNYRVNPAATRTVVTSSLNPIVFGQQVTYTATVSVNAPGNGTLAGNVTFRAGTTVLGTSALVGNRATLTTSATPPGNQTITATYTATANFAASTSAGIAQRVNPAATRTTLTSSLGATIFGQSVTFTAVLETLAPGSGTTTGTVTFRSGATNLGTVTLSNGRAVFPITTLGVATHAITAVFNANASYAASTSAALSHRVTAATSRTALTVNINPSVVGQAVTYTATVSAVAPGAGTPLGNVTFRNGGTVLGTVALANGVARLASAALAQGTHTITATYNGEARFTTSVSAGHTQRVFHNTTVALTRSANPSVFGQSVTFTATVNRAPNLGVPTGTVTFRDGSSVLATVNVAGNGTAAFTTTSLSMGGHSFTAAYSGDARFINSTSAVLGHTVNRANTTTALTSSIPTTVFGQATTFTATVRPNAPGAGTPTGSVTFRNGATNLATVALTNGMAQFTTSSLVVGAFNITAVYGSESRFNASTSAVVVQRVNRAGTRTQFTTSLNPSLFGDSVTFTAVVNPVAPGAGTPTGTVTFRDGAAVLGTVNLTNARATFTSATLAIGLHSITATYNGDTRFNASALESIAQRVKSHTRTTLATSLSPTRFGEPVTFTATVAAVAPGAGVPPGTITFRDGNTVLGTVPLTGGVARLTTGALAVADHPITAAYNGDVAYGNSASPTLIQRVSRADTRTLLVSSAEPSVFGQPVTFTATVAAVAPGAGTPAGTMTFRNGTTVLATLPLDGSGRAQFTTAALTVASHNITATYSGNVSFHVSGPAALTQRVNRAAATAVVVSTAAPSVFGQSVLFTVTVRAAAPGAGTPSGEVTFRDGNTILGTQVLNAAGQASLETSALTVGAHNITATYGGSGNFTSITSPGFDQVVNRAATRTTLTTSLYPSLFGQAITFTAATQILAPGAGRQTGTVAFLDGNTQLGTATLNAQGIATFTLSTLAIGRHSITAAYQGDGNFSSSTSAVLSQRVNRHAHGYAAQAQAFDNTRIANQPGAFVILNGPADDVSSPVALGNRRFNFYGTSYDSLHVSSNGLVTFGRGSTLYDNAPLADAPAEAALAPLWDDWTMRESRPAIWGRYEGNRLRIEWTDFRHFNPPSVSPSTVTFQVILELDTGLEWGNVIYNYHDLNTGNFASDGATATVGLKASGTQGDHRIVVSHNARATLVQSNRAILLAPEEHAPVATRTTLTSSANPAIQGAPLTFTAVVAALNSSAGIPSGPVTFRSGNTVLGTATLDINRRAAFTTSALALGTHTVTATYDGAGRFAASVSPQLEQRVVSTINLVVTGLPANATAGKPESFVVSLMDPNGDLITDYRGTVSFGSSDPRATLPAAYTFTEEDGGQHEFAAGATFLRAGRQTLTAFDDATQLRWTAELDVSPAAASRIVLSGVPAVVAAGSLFDLTVTALDPFDNRATGYRGTITFATTSKWAFLPDPYAFTEEDAGRVTFTGLVLHQAGEQYLTVTDQAAPDLSETVAVEVTPLAPVALELAVAASATAGEVFSMIVTARDQFGNVATGYRGTVRFTSTDGGAFLPVNFTFTTADAGVGYFDAALVTAGFQAITVRDVANGSLESVAGLEILPEAASWFELALPSTAVAGHVFSLTVTARDGYGNVATGYRGRVRFGSTDANGFLPGDYTFTAADGGVGYFDAALVTAGYQTMTVRDVANGDLETSMFLEILPDAANWFELEIPSRSVAGSTFGFTVTARDGYGNVATGYRGRVRFTTSDARGFLPEDYTFAAGDGGVGYFLAAFLTSGYQTLTVRDLANGDLSAEGLVEVVPDVVAGLRFDLPEASTAGGAFDLLVVAVDAYENVVTNYRGTIRFQSSDGQALLPANYTFTADDAGMHWFTGVTLFTASYQLVRVEDAAIPAVSVEAYSLVEAAEAAQFLLEGPEQVRTGESFSLRVTVVDAYGNVVSNYRGTLNFGSSDSSALLPASYTFTAADGGSHLFTGLVLSELGSQEIGVMDENGLLAVIAVEVLPEEGSAPGGSAVGTPGFLPRPGSTEPQPEEARSTEPRRMTPVPLQFVAAFLPRKANRWQLAFDWSSNF